MIVNIPIVIEDWVEWVAICQFGDVYGFKVRPHHDNTLWLAGIYPKKYICTTTPPQDWTKELYKVIDGELVRSE